MTPEFKEFVRSGIVSIVARHNGVLENSIDDDSHLGPYPLNVLCNISEQLVVELEPRHSSATVGELTNICVNRMLQ